MYICVYIYISLSSLRHQQKKYYNKPDIIKVIAGCVKNKIMSLFKTNTTENHSKTKKSKITKPSEDKMIKATEDRRIIRNIRNLFEQEADYYKLVRVGNFFGDK